MTPCSLPSGYRSTSKFELRGCECFTGCCLFHSFQVLDPDRNGYIEPDKMREYLTSSSESGFREKEIEGMGMFYRDGDADCFIILFFEY
jgi:hypothetical protein